MARQCVFCAGPVNSREHIFPDWLRQFGDSDQLIYWDWRLYPLGDQLSDEGKQQRIHRAKPFSIKARAVCRACNCGWMSRLENSAQPVLTPLILDQPTRLESSHLRLIALWTSKAILTFSCGYRPEARYPKPGEFEWFYENQEPLPRLHVWIASYGEDIFDPKGFLNSGATLMGFASPPPPWLPGQEYLYPNPVTTYSGFILLGRLLIFFVRFSPWGYFPVRQRVHLLDRVQEVWPEVPDSVQWPLSSSLSGPDDLAWAMGVRFGIPRTNRGSGAEFVDV